jgi:hypothetical protein
VQLFSHHARQRLTLARASVPTVGSVDVSPIR